MPPRTIALPAAVALVIANMVGTGVFTSLGFQVPALPAVVPILSLWVVGGIVSLCGALCYAEVVAMRPRSGGEYHLLREAYHPLAGFLAGWISLVAGFAAPMALAAMAFGKYMTGLGCPYDGKLVATVVIVFIVAVHLAHLGVVEKVLGGLTLLKVGLILAFIAGALIAVDRRMVPEPGLTPKLADLKMVFSGSFAQSLVYVMYAYTGWNGAAYIASEVRDPQRNVPRALILGTVTVMVLYVGLNAAILYRAPWSELSGKVEVALVAATVIFGERGGWWMGGLISLGLLSMIAGLTWAGSRVNQRIGQDFPGLSLLAKTNSQG
ncbi:MAG: APC family permease, partial [Verrucomicrobiales bacterium]|nr:APC family permease [Verrucomicrobiales bacterium]